MNIDRLNELLLSLDEYQREPVGAGSGAIAVVGNPGSGKSRVVVARIGRLARDGLDPKYMLAMTFTRNAAAVMNERLTELGVHSCRIGTIHSVCRQVLIEGHAFPKGLTLASNTQSDILLKQTIVDMTREKRLGGVGHGHRKSVDVESVSKFVNECKATGVCYIADDPFGLNEYAENRILEIAERWQHTTRAYAEDLYSFYAELDRKRVKQGLYNFDDMLLWAWSFLVADKRGFRQMWRSRWSVVIVDEGQDSNRIQWDLAYMLTGLKTCTRRTDIINADLATDDDGGHNLLVAGDPSQAIYGFRNGDPAEFLSFVNRPETTLYKLPINYRSLPQICTLGTNLVKDKAWHLAGDIMPEPRLADASSFLADIITEPSINIVDYPSPDVEAAETVARCQERYEDSGSYRSCAVLSRLSIFLDLIEIECIRKHIPYVKRAGAGSFCDSKEVVDILSYLRVAAGHDSDGEHLRRVIRTPFRYIGKISIDKAFREAGCNEYEKVLDGLYNDRSISLRIADEAHKLKGLLNRMKARLESPSTCITMMLEWTNYIEETQTDAELQQHPDTSRAAIIAELLRLARQFKDTTEFLIYIDRLSSAIREGQKRLQVKEGNEVGQDHLILSTIHRAKGLEWSHVYLCDVIQGNFPCSRAESFDEELRLFYVAVTRAKNSFTMSFTKPAEGDEESILTRLARSILGVCSDG